MPSPVGHSLAAIAVSMLGGRWFAGASSHARAPAPRTPSIGSRLGLLAALVLAANAPDLDFVPGILLGDPDRFHHGPSHSLGAAAMFGAAAALAARALRLGHAQRLACLLTFAFVSHLLLDMFSLDRRPPAGVPFFWPLSGDHVALPVALFLDIHRDPRAESFLAGIVLRHNLTAVIREVVVMGLALAAVGAIAITGELLRGRRRFRRRDDLHAVDATREEVRTRDPS